MKPNLALIGSVLRVERSSIHDGKGLRTVVFLKGCPLHCNWCSTPESQSLAPEKGYVENLCTGCGKCVDVCPNGALSLTNHPDIASKQVVITDRNKCTGCFKCAVVCLNSAVKKYGLPLSVADLLQEINRDEIFYYHSGGGVTLSGGEPLSQPLFAATILRECKKNGIHTAIESSFHMDFINIEASLPWLDLLYVDIKHMNSDMHQDWVGESNKQILENIKRVDQSAYPLEIIIRVPLIPGYNDSDHNLGDTVNFCAGLKKLKAIELLPYHRLGSDTYSHLGISYPGRDLVSPSREHLLERAAMMQRKHPHITVLVGSGFSEA
jgi:pyruvate formate lyase activating enzyme